MITLASPASLEDCWSFAGGRPRVRKMMIAMHQAGETVMVFDDGEPIAAAFIVPDGAGRRELCLAIASRARARMRELCRAAHLILSRMAEDGTIICYVVPENRAGVRMARIVGFRPDPDHRYRWIFAIHAKREPANEPTVRTVRRQRRGEGGPGAAPPAGGVE